MFNVIIFSTLYAVLNVSGAAIIKRELKLNPINSVNDFIPLLLNIKIDAALLIIFVSALVMFKALSLSKFSVVVPIATGINFVLTILIGYFLFQDKLSILHFLGIVIVLTGIIIISFAERT